MKEFGLQLWSIRDEFTTEENVKTAFLKMKEFGYTQAQTAGTYDFIDPKLFRKYADDAGIKIVGTHYSLDRMINDVEGTIEYHKILGTDEIGIGGKGVKNLGEMRLYKAVQRTCKSISQARFCSLVPQPFGRVQQPVQAI